MLESLPRGWEEKTLGELCSLRRELVEPSSTGAQRYVGLEHIDPGVFRLRRWGDERGLRSTKSRFHSGDVLYGKLRPYLDKAVLAEWEGVCSTDILTIQPRSDVADSSYLAFLVHTPAFIAHAVATTSGVNHPRTGWSEIARFSHPIPPLAEQRVIAGVLAKIQAAVEVQEKIIATLRELKAATMAKLFHEGLRGEPLKQTEIGEVPQSWSLRTIGSLGKLVTGTTPPTKNPEYYGGEIPFISPKDIGEWRIVRSAEKTLTEAGAAVSRPLPRRAVLVVCIGSSIGKVGMTSARVSCTNQQINAIICDEGVVPEFVHYLMVWNTDRVRGLSTPSPVPILTKGVFEDAMIAWPADPDEQRGIAKVLCAVDDRIEAAEKDRHILKTIFSSMLHLLMTGRVRVTRKMIALLALADRAARQPKWSGKVDEKLLEEVVRRIVETAAPEKIILFGSAARGEMEPDSDLDLLVVKSCADRREVARAISESLRGIGLPKDVLVVTPEDVEEQKDIPGMTIRAALREGRVLYAA